MVYMDPLPAAGRPIKTLEDDKIRKSVAHKLSLPATGRQILRARDLTQITHA